LKPTTLKGTLHEFVIPSSANNTSSLGRASLKRVCKTIIGSRTKQSGMFWTVRGANAIITLRCCQLNGRFEEYWEARRA